MIQQRRGSRRRSRPGTADGGDAAGGPEALGRPDEDPFEDWERTPAVEAEEAMGYQRLAWVATPAGSSGLSLLVIAFAVNLVRRVARAGIRLLMR